MKTIYVAYADCVVAHNCFLFVFVFLVNFPDLKWVQVSSADEALKVMKLGKRNQSISSTKLNLLSSRRYKFLPGAYLF